MNVTERFLKYVSFPTLSDEESETIPSTSCQKVLGAYLADELKTIGLGNAHMDEYGYVYGFLPASKGNEDMDALGLIAHMDTSPAVSGENIRPSIVKYAGGDLHLSDTVTMTVSDFPFLADYEGKELIVTDGSTLLGADDKAGVAEIVTLCQYLVENPEIKHRPIAVCFTPDEEIGRGPDKFDFSKFPAQTAYTVDGGELGEIEYENFNAAAVSVKIHGVNIHPGSAKNKMKNAILIANKFLSMLPDAETPAHTEGYEGFYHVCSIQGNETEANISMIIRDHDIEKFTERKAFVSRITAYLNEVHGEGTVETVITDSYYNMREKILPHMYLIENAENAMRSVGITPKIVPIRGGTDGARLSFSGLPCPNLSTGGLNFHSIYEFVPVEALEKMVKVLEYLVKA